jgi:hypothetical protein
MQDNITPLVGGPYAGARVRFTAGTTLPFRLTKGNVVWVGQYFLGVWKALR